MLRRKSAFPTHNRPETNKQPTGRWWWDGLCANDATNFVNKSSRKSPSPLSLSSWCGSVSVFLPSSETCFFVRSYWMIFFPSFEEAMFCLLYVGIYWVFRSGCWFFLLQVFILIHDCAVLLLFSKLKSSVSGFFFFRGGTDPLMDY